jgi:predicted GTPase
MQQSLKPLWEALADATILLEDSVLRQRIDSLQTTLQEPRLKVLIIGEPGSGRASLLNAALCYPDLLLATAVSKRPDLRWRLTYGESLSVSVLDPQQGEQQPWEPAALRKLLIEGVSRTLFELGCQ